MRNYLLLGLLTALPLLSLGCSSSGDSSDTPSKDASFDTLSDGGTDAPYDAPGQDVLVTPDTGTPDADTCASGLLCGSTGTCCPANTECVDDTCQAACSSGVRCADQCCGDGQVCVSGTCKTPTTTCLDSVDCTPSEFCEPTLLKCVGQVPGGAICLTKRPVVALAPVLKWSWTTPTVLPDYDQTISAPLVADVDHDGTPDVFVSTGNKQLANLDNKGYLRRLDGVTGKEGWGAQVDALQAANQIQVTASPALGDLDGDGTIEIVTLAATRDLIAFHADGSLAWRSKRKDGSSYVFSLGFTWGSALSIADMDGNGKAEVVVAGVVFDSGGVLVSGDGRESIGGTGSIGGHNGTSSIVADVDLDGKQELVGGAGAYRRDGTAVWEDAAAPEGYPAIADFDKDGTPELVVAAPGAIRVLDAATGALVASIANPAASPGPPVIADFDGDGTPEVGVQYYKPCEMVVFEVDKAAKTISQKWLTPMLQCSGYLTPTAFDFNGDGQVEVLAHDDCHVNVMKGTTGEIQLRIQASHNTWTEFVSVADVDGDKEADLIFSTNDAWNGGLLDWATYCQYTGTDTWSHGVFVYHQPGAWMPTRRVWNQQSYHITNVKADGTIPAKESVSWGSNGYNNYRVSAQGKGASMAPNLVVSLSASQSACPAHLRLLVSVRNSGSVSAPAGIHVSLYKGTSPNGTLLTTLDTTKSLSPGASEVLEYKTAGSQKPASFYAIVDEKPAPNGQVTECAEDDNMAQLSGAKCPGVR